MVENYYSGSVFKYEYIFIFVYMKGIGLNCIVIDLFVTEKRRVENCMSESVLIDSIQIIISIIIRVRGSMYLKQISNEIKIKYIDLTEW